VERHAPLTLKGRPIYFPAATCGSAAPRSRRGEALGKPQSNRFLPRRVSSPGVAGCASRSCGPREGKSCERLRIVSLPPVWSLLPAFAAMPAQAADIDATSTVDAVTVYPDGASVTRVITLDLPAGDNTLVARDFPLTLDAASLRVEGEAGTNLTIGAIDTRPPRAAPPVICRTRPAHRDAEGRARQPARRDCCGHRAAQIRRALRRSLSRRVGRERRGASDRRMARGLCRGSEEVAAADTAIRDAERKQRDIDRELARLESDRAIKPPSRLEVRVDLAAAATTKATLRVDLLRAQRALDAALRCPSRHRGEGSQARARTGAPRGNRAGHRRGTGRMSRLPSRRFEPRAGVTRPI